MQVIASERPFAGVPGRASMLVAFAVGTTLVVAAAVIVALVFGTGLLDAFMPRGRPTLAQQILGALAWTAALTGPAGFAIIGVVRLASAMERLRARRPRRSPVLRLAEELGDDHIVATRVSLPDGSRVVPEIVIGPFGVAVIEELPPPGAVLSRGVRTWEVRVANGRVQNIENPLERAYRDAERVRSWFEGEDRDRVVKVFAAVVGTDPRVLRTPTCAVLGPAEVAAWLRALAPQRSFDADRRAEIVRMVREVV